MARGSFYIDSLKKAEVDESDKLSLIYQSILFNEVIFLFSFYG